MTRVALHLSLAAGAALIAATAPAASAQVVDTCPNAVYRNGAAANLPDCRAWEQITPVDKGGERAEERRTGYASADGDRLIFSSKTDPSDSEGNGRTLGSLFASIRNPSWSTLGLEPPLDPYAFNPNSLARAISGDRSKVLAISLRKLTPGAVEGASNVYARDTRDRSFTLLASFPGQDLFEFSTGPSTVFYWGSRDFSTVVIATYLALTPDAPTDNSGKLYVLSGGRASLVSRDVDGTPLPVEPSARAEPDRVSTDGRRVTFTGGPTGALYQKVQGASTVLISRSHRAGDDQSTPVSAGPGFPSPDGTEVTFASGSLTDDGAGPLYRWSANGDRLTNLLAGVSVPWSADAFLEIRQVSDDGRYVWLTVEDQGVPGARVERLAVVDTATKRVAIRASVTDGTLASGTGIAAFRFSPDGTKLVLASPSSLTGYDQANPQCTDGRCFEAFYFDAAQPVVDPVCISCGGPGTSSVGRVDVVPDRPIDAEPLPESVADSGQAVFGTAQRLTTGDVNNVSDVYVYTPGRGASLISSGTGNSPAGPVAITPSGSDAFFRTADPLVPQDNDSSSDFYDARVNGGLAAQQVVAVSGGSCPLGKCPGADVPVSAAQPAGTATFQAPTRPPAFVVARVPLSTRRSAARSGRLPVTVTIGAPGTISARAKARIGRRSITVGRSSLTSRKAGRFTLRLTLSRTARATLARERTLTVTIAVSYSRASKNSSQNIKLSAGPIRRTTKGGAR